MIANFASAFFVAADGELLSLYDGTRSTHKPMNLRDREYFNQTLAQGCRWCEDKEFKRLFLARVPLPRQELHNLRKQRTAHVHTAPRVV